MIQARLLRLHHRARGIGSCPRRFFSREVLVDLRSAQRAGALQGARTLGVVSGICGGGLCLCHGRARLRNLGSQGVTRQGCQHLTLSNAVAYVHMHLRQAQAARLGPDARFLPGHDVAVGR